MSHYYLSALSSKSFSMQSILRFFPLFGVVFTLQWNTEDNIKFLQFTIAKFILCPFLSGLKVVTDTVANANNTSLVTKNSG